MSNINDYLTWRGDLKVSPLHPFNEVDAMVLARVSYLPFDKIKMYRKETIKSLLTRMIIELKPEDYRWADDTMLVIKLLDSIRFSHMRISNYVLENNKQKEQQFSAVTIHIDHTEMYISYFGTDDTIVGWKEDFNLAILDHIPSQEEGKNYLTKIAKQYPWKTIRVGGHSKGGNIAMYSAITVSDHIQRRILKVYNFDGPGLKKGTAALDQGHERVLKRIESFIPQDSVIGRLLEHTEKITVVKSIEKNLYQHDIYSWQVEKDHVIESDTTRSSDIADETISLWIEKASEEERTIFVNTMFEIFDTSGVNTPIDIMQNWKKYIPRIIKTYRSVPKERRDTVIAVWKKLAESYLTVKPSKNK